MLTPTPEQEAIIEAARERSESLCISAYAGTGKTSTLELLARVLPPKPSLATAFNVKIKKELERRLPPNFTVMTLNGLGHRAWSDNIGRRCEIDERKLGKLVTAACKEAHFSANSDDWDTIRAIAQKAMQLGLVPKDFKHYYNNGLIPDEPEVWADIADSVAFGTAAPAAIGIARNVVIANIKQGFAGIISYDDQIYLSALFGGRFPKFNLALIDEAQDLSPLNREQIARTATGRIILCGDQMQSIYSFRGADSDSINQLLKLRNDWIKLPLATTFRCPKAIVGRQQSHAEGYKAFPSAPEGEVISFLPTTDAPDGKPWSWPQIAAIAKGRDVAVLCRNTAPLLSLAFRLLRNSIGCTMLGRDIGKGLVALSKKILPDDTLPTANCLSAIEAWRTSEISLAEANHKHNAISGIHDRADCLIAVAATGAIADAGQLRAKLVALFARENDKITLGTGHRSKGLEWDVVVHLDPWRIPSPFAHSPIDLQQEANLRYVIETRTKTILIEANLENFS